MIDNEIKQSGHTWKSYAESIDQNPSNFKRQLIKNIEKLNNWLSPLNLQIQITTKGGKGKKKRKRLRAQKQAYSTNALASNEQVHGAAKV